MKYILIIIILFFPFLRLIASEAEMPDTLKIYQLGGVEVTDKRVKVSNITKADIPNISYHTIQSSDVLSISDMQLYLPSGYVRTNSRGESMLFIRGAGERQLGLFFDGVSMNIPWDNRLDLTSVPSDMIGNIRVNKSANSIFYGPNVLGGAVSISTIERASDGYGLSAKLQAGDGNSQGVSMIHDGRIGNFNYIANLSYYKSDGFLMSGNAPDSLANQKVNSSLRTNTDQKRMNAYLRGEYKFNATTLGLSFSFLTQEKGVAAETFEGEDARFWRYPERDRFIITFNGSHDFSDELSMRATIWYDLFSQKIEDYKSFEYKDINETQKDKDNTIGARVSLNYQLNGDHRLSIVFNGFATEHDQSINDSDNTVYTQNTISTGAEYSGMIDNFSINAGLGYDHNQTPKTGIFTEAEGGSQSDLAGFLSLKYHLTSEFCLTLSSSRRTRFPTMREQYDGALGKFKTNPDLKPETGLLNEFGLIYATDHLSIKAVGFYNMYDDMIERIRLTEDQDPQKRRMRVNYAEVEISGLDLNFAYNGINNMQIDGFLTYMNMQQEQNNEKIEHLVQKPELLAGLMTYYRFDFGLIPQIELEYTGKMYDSDADGGYVEIDPAMILNFRISYSIYFSDMVFTEFFVRVNNLTDKYKLSQYGLPSAGRTAIAGLTVRI
jgi:iron complex outermembrane recepter protein